MYETEGTVTSISSFSEAHDQITIQMVIPAPLGEEGQIHSHDWIVPKGQVEVGDKVTIVIKVA